MARPHALLILAAASLLVSCSRQPAAGVAVADAWVRLPAVPGRPGAAYFTLEGGSADDRLRSIGAPPAARAEMHEGGMSGGMMTMRPLAARDVPAGGRTAFAPGGDHVMLYGIDPTLTAGGTMPLDFHFGSGVTRRVEAKLVAAGDPAPTFDR